MEVVWRKFTQLKNKYTMVRRTAAPMAAVSFIPVFSTGIKIIADSGKFAAQIKLTNRMCLVENFGMLNA
ncbi:MAG: hypothetical protein CFE23_12190 [Flavobacterium sp. BFFFF1]|nr:MAG: hypothetical protein CFE23_12190 [Flavobacterium sp. BFFFF1]